MAQDQLGLFDTPPDRRQIQVGVAIVCLLCASFPLIYPVRDTAWPAVHSFVPMVDAVIVLGEAITATLLYAQAAVFRSRALVALATGYVFSALLLVPHALTFPGAFDPEGLLGAGVNTTAWLAYGRRTAFPAAILLYVWLRRAETAAEPGAERPPVRIFVSLTGAFTLAGLATLLATVGHDLLPPFFLNQLKVINPYFIWYQLAQLVLCGVAGVMLFRARRSVLTCGCWSPLRAGWSKR